MKFFCYKMYNSSDLAAKTAAEDEAVGHIGLGEAAGLADAPQRLQRLLLAGADLLRKKLLQLTPNTKNTS